MVAWASLRFWLAGALVNAAFDIFGGSREAGEQVGLHPGLP